MKDFIERIAQSNVLSEVSKKLDNENKLVLVILLNLKDKIKIIKKNEKSYHSSFKNFFK